MQENKKKSKKLFGIFNIVDIVFIAVVILAALIFVLSRFGSRVGAKDYVIGFYGEEVSDFVCNNLKIGSPVGGEMDFDKLGNIIDVDIYPSVSYAADDQGRFIRSSKEGYKAVVIYCKVTGVKNDYGLYVNGHTYLPGHTFTLYSDNAKLYLRVFSLQEITEYDADKNPVFEKPDLFTDLEDMEFAVTDSAAVLPAVPDDASATETDETQSAA